MSLQVACIVEGHGEAASVPILIRRVAASIDPPVAVDVTPIRVSKSKLLKPEELKRAVELAAMRSGTGGILLLLDADDDCPARLGPDLLAQVQRIRPDKVSAVVLANKEFESWFLAAAESLGGHRKLRRDLQSPARPEVIRGAKEWLSNAIEGGVYSPTLDQPALTAIFDFEQAKRSPSFQKCYREIVRMIEALRGTEE